MPSQQPQQYEIPRELQEILLDFTVHYLVEQPGDVVDFALEYFSRLNASRRSTNDVQHSDDESMLSDDEAPSNGNVNYNLNVANVDTIFKKYIFRLFSIFCFTIPMTNLTDQY